MIMSELDNNDACHEDAIQMDVDQWPKHPKQETMGKKILGLNCKCISITKKTMSVTLSELVYGRPTLWDRNN
jgi:hypothetical protein